MTYAARGARVGAKANVARMGGWMLVAALALLPMQGILSAVSQVFGPAHYHVAHTSNGGTHVPTSPDDALRVATDSMRRGAASSSMVTLASAATTRLAGGPPAGAIETDRHDDALPNAQSSLLETAARGHLHPHYGAAVHRHYSHDEPSAAPRSHAHPHPHPHPLASGGDGRHHPADERPDVATTAPATVAANAHATDAPQAQPAPHSHADIGQHHHRGPADDVVYLVGDGQRDNLSLRAGTNGLDHCWSLMPGDCSVVGVRGRAALFAVVAQGHARPTAGAPRRPPRRSGSRFLP